jgi:hypothetical protein
MTAFTIARSIINKESEISLLINHSIIVKIISALNSELIKRNFTNFAF